MAIVEMSRISIAVLKSDRRKLMNLLSALGVTDISNLTKEEMENQFQGLLDKADYGREITDCDSDLKELKSAIDLLAKYAGRKHNLFTLKREYAREEYEKIFKQLPQKRELFESITAQNARRAALKNQKSSIQAQLQSLAMWKVLPFELEAEGTKTMLFTFGTLDFRTDLAQLKPRLGAITSANLFASVNQDDHYQYCYLVYPKDYARECDLCLKEAGWNRAAFANLTGTVPENMEKYKKKLQDIEEEQQKIEAYFKECAKNLDEYEFLYDAILSERTLREADARAAYTNRTAFLTGWTPTQSAQTVKAVIERNLDAAVEITQPSEEEEYPILLQNPQVVQPFEVITEMYSLPSARSRLDPNKVLAVFYFILFGMMVSDAGYGLLVMLFCGLFVWKFKPEGQMGKMMRLIGLGGLSTFLWGALFGSWFGDVIPVLSNYTFDMPRWFSPMEDPMKLLIVSFIVGALHIMAGMGMKAYMLIRSGHVWDAVFDIGSWYLVFIGIGLYAAGMALGGLTGQIGLYTALAGVVLLLFTQGRHEKNIFKKAFRGISSLYNIVSYFSDILSYSRLLAMGLSTSVVASVVNTLGLLGGRGVGGMILFAAVFLVGHIFNMSINLLGAYVHTSRLQYVEFFGKFYEGGGTAFRPLKLNGKYTKIQEPEIK